MFGGGALRRRPRSSTEPSWMFGSTGSLDVPPGSWPICSGTCVTVDNLEKHEDCWVVCVRRLLSARRCRRGGAPLRSQPRVARAERGRERRHRRRCSAHTRAFPSARVITSSAVSVLTTCDSAVVVLGLWFVYQFLAGFLASAWSTTGHGVAWWAHIGGFVFGGLTFWLFAAGRPRSRATVG